MDLRGLNMQSLQTLLGGATDLRNLKGRELDQEQERQLRLLDIMTKPEPNVQRPTNTLSATYLKDGKYVKDRIENGEVVGQVAAPPPNPVDPSIAALRDIMIGDKLDTRESKLAGYRTAIESGKVGGRELDPATKQTYIDLFNKQSPDEKFVEKDVPRSIIGFKLPWKWTEKTTHVRVPKSGNAGGAPPVGTVDGGYKFKGGDPANPENWEKI